MPTALVIDDDPHNLRLLSAMISRFGYDVYSCERGDKGVDKAKEIQPDLVAVDLLMPKSTYDGLQVAKVLRSLPVFKTTPIIAVSAADAHTIKMQLVDSLFNDFVQKPITLEKLESLFDRLSRRDTA